MCKNSCKDFWIHFRSGISGPWGSCSVSNIWRSPRTDFKTGCNNFHSHQQYVNMPISLHSHQNLSPTHFCSSWWSFWLWWDGIIITIDTHFSDVYDDEHIFIFLFIYLSFISLVQFFVIFFKCYHIPIQNGFT